MALDKQKILSELGSVVNQLQSADCGCMSKLFSNPCQTANQNMSMCGNHAQDCYGHGYSCHQSCRPHNAPPACNPYTNMHSSFTPHCNPPKLYTDTYNYLNQNLMQPVIKEVYEDLKSISPENTIMNNPMANVMGLSNPGNQQNHMKNYMQQNQIARTGGNISDNIEIPHQNAMNPNNMEQIGGMGPNIVNMMMSSNPKPSTGSQLLGQSESMPCAMNPTAYGQNKESKLPVNGLQAQNPNMQHYIQSQVGASNQKSQMHPQSQYSPVNNLNPLLSNGNPVQSGNHANYGKHSQGMAKFQEMFPGVMQGLGGDLGFDPMAVAIQMNPANQPKPAMQNMQQLGENDFIRTSNRPQTAQPLAGVTLPANISLNSQPKTENQLQSTINNQVNAEQPLVAVNNELALVQQQLVGAVPQQQVYTARNTEATINQLPIEKSIPKEGIHEPNAVRHVKEHNPELMKDPQNQFVNEVIFPADATNGKLQNNYGVNNQMLFEYNTLGQPVEKFPAELFRPPVVNLPQTLSPQDHLPPAYASRLIANQVSSNVKSTVSKTSIVGNRSVGKVPSRSQLQHIYNKYKDSKAEQGATSQGRIFPLERVGGDSLANNQNIGKTEQRVGQFGDVLTKPNADSTDQTSKISRCRNGLQDIVYISNSSTPAWSFHGNK